MTHKTITVNQYANIEWIENRQQALKRKKELEKQGCSPIIAGKKARTNGQGWFTWNDLYAASLFRDNISNIGSDWVIAWNDKEN